MTWIRRGAIIYALATMNQDWRKWTGGSLILSPTDTRKRQVSVTVFHEHITKQMDSKWIYKDWYQFLEPSDMELADNALAIQRQNQELLQNSSDEPIMEEIPQTDESVLGLYLGKWFINPDRDVQRENRVILALVSERPVWIPIIA
jgi:hypothetical protein